MPIPLKPGENIYVDRKVKPADYAMPTMEVALDHYSIGYLITGDRKWFSYSKIGISHAGDIGFQKPGIFHRNLPMSDVAYDRFLIKYRKETILPVIDCIGESEFDALHTEYLRFDPSSQAVLFPQFQAMLEEYEKNSPYSQLILQGMLQRLILTIYEEKLPYREPSMTLQSYDARIHDAFIYIEEHYAQDPTLEEVAGYVCLSVSYFSKLFHKVSGTTFSDYLMNTKLQHAQILLGCTDLSVNEIALRTGFANGNYFCVVFKERYHLAPSAFRRQTALSASLQNRYTPA